MNRARAAASTDNWNEIKDIWESRMPEDKNPKAFFFNKYIFRKFKNPIRIFIRFLKRFKIE